MRPEWGSMSHNLRALGERERIIYRQEFVLRERARGKTLDEVHAAWTDHVEDALELRVSRRTVENDIKEGLKRKSSEMDMSAAQIRELLTLRLDNALKAESFQKRLERGDLAAIDRLIRMTEQYSKIYGAYAPTKVAQTDPTGEKEAGLSDEERTARIMALLEKAELRKLDEEEADREMSSPDPLGAD